MQARRLPARHGALWLLAGLRLFRANPPMLSALALGYLVFAVAINLLPYIGPFLLPLILPLLTLMVANGCRAIERGGSRPAGDLMAGLRERRDALLRLGGLQLAGSLLLLASAYAFNIDSGVLGDGEPDPQAMAWMFARLLALSLPLLVAFWFAPLLVGWDNTSALKSVFFSLVAVLRNWRAFLCYLLVIAIAGIALPGLLIGLAALLSEALAQGVALALRMMLIFVLAPALIAGAYISYRDIFVHE